MSEIPEDIKAEAEELAAEWEMEPGPHRMLVVCFASAIREERERCARIAVSEYANWYDPYATIMPEHIGEYIADAIRQPHP